MKRLKDYYPCFSLKCIIVRIVLFPGIHTFPPIFCALIIFLCLILKEKKAHSSVGVACDFKTECPRRQLISFFFFFFMQLKFLIFLQSSIAGCHWPMRPYLLELNSGYCSYLQLCKSHNGCTHPTYHFIMPTALTILMLLPLYKNVRTILLISTLLLGNKDKLSENCASVWEGLRS